MPAVIRAVWLREWCRPQAGTNVIIKLLFSLNITLFQGEIGFFARCDTVHRVTVDSESMVHFWKSARQVSLTEEDQGSQRVNGKSTRAQACTGTLLDVAKDLEGRYWGRWREEIGLDTLVSPLTSNLFPSPHTCALRLICGPMALLYSAITYWNWMRAGWSCVISTERHGEAPHFTPKTYKTTQLLRYFFWVSLLSYI